MKVIEWKVVCPDCGHIQTYHSHQAQVDGQRSKNCEKCPRSFAVKKHRLKDLPQVKKRLKEEQEKKGTGFHTYSRRED